MEHTQEHDKSQQVAPVKTLTPQQLVRVRVAKSIWDSNEWNAGCNWTQFEKDIYLGRADAAIAAHIEALVDMELPRQVIGDAKIVCLDAFGSDEIQKIFLAVCVSLKGGAK